MPKADSLPPETDQDRDGYVVVDEYDVYVGHRAKLREIVKRKGAGGIGRIIEPRRVNGIFQNVRAKGVRTTIADITRVHRGKDGGIYLTGVIVSSHCEGEDPIQSNRFMHKLGGPAMKSGQKEIAILPGTGPDDATIENVSAVNHSKAVRMGQWKELVEKALAGGVRLPVLHDALVDRADHQARAQFERRSNERVGRGGEALVPTPDLGKDEIALVGPALAFEVEPEHWMWGTVAEAANDPNAFIAANDYQAAFA